MDLPESFDVVDDFAFIRSFLPGGWEEKAKELGALRRCRKIPNARVLLQLLLIHLAEGLSLRETSAWAKQSNILDISDVAIMDRLHGSTAWFQWMNQEMMKSWTSCPAPALNPSQFRVRVVDGSHVKEPGPTGSIWRIHYSIDLSTLHCDEFHLTPNRGKGAGEGLQQFSVQPGDLVIGDRAYGISRGISHVVQAGGDVLVRFSWSNLPLWHPNGDSFDLFAHLRSLQGTRIGDWPVMAKAGDQLIPGRVCAIRRSRQSAEKAIRHAEQKSKKGGSQVTKETLEAAKYIFVFTTVDNKVLPPLYVLEFYRGRWQIELVFKRMKSLMGVGHLRKYDDEASLAWLQGKLLVAFLLEALLRHGESFFPWGYPLRPDEST